MANIRTMSHALPVDDDANVRPLSMRVALMFWLVASFSGWSLVVRLI